MHIFVPMKNPLKYLMLPLAWIYGLGLMIRDRLFQISVWKSVEFELPIIKVGGLSDVESQWNEKISRWIQGMLGEANLPTALIRHVKFSKPKEGDQFEYLRLTGEEMIFDTVHRVMGVSEIAFEFPSVKSVILNDAFRTMDIRGSFDVLVMDANQPIYEDLLAPAGGLKGFREEALRAKAVFIFGFNEHIDLDELKSNLSPDVSIYFANDLGMEIEVLQDGDKFAAEFNQFIDQSK